MLERIRAQKRSIYYVLVSTLSFYRPEDLALLNLPLALQQDIALARQDDDFYGRGALGLSLLITSRTDFTRMDRIVVGQVLSVTAAAVTAGNVATLSLILKNDVMRKAAVAQGLFDWWNKDNELKPENFGDAALNEELVRFHKYADTYNRAVVAGEFDLFWKSDEREAEASYYGGE